MTYDSIIVGAGIIGLGIAWRASQLGMSVLVLDRADPPQGASWVAAGMLAPVTEAGFGEEPLLRLNLASARRWPGFLAELAASSGMPLHTTGEGTLFVALDRDQSEALRRLFEYQVESGLGSRWLSSSDCRGLEPGLHPGTRSGILAGTDVAVDPRMVTRALRIAVQAAGGHVSPGCAVRSIVTGQTPGVELEDRSFLGCKAVVLAAGAWSGSIPGAGPHVAAGIRPVKGQILRLRTPSSQPVLTRYVIRTEEVYLVPRPEGELVVGATLEEKGFDTAATAGGVFELLRAAGEVLPGIRELELAGVDVGLRPGTRDNAPMLGESGLPGLVVATGHYRHGVLLTPVTAGAIAELLSKGEAPAELAPFSPCRFASCKFAS